MKNTKTKMLCEAAIFIAMAEILSLIKLYEFPNGGSVDCAMVPIILFAVRHGCGWGAGAGLVYGAITYLIGNKFSIDWTTIICDYFLAYTLLGFGAGLLPLHPGDEPPHLLQQGVGTVHQHLGKGAHNGQPCRVQRQLADVGQQILAPRVQHGQAAHRCTQHKTAAAKQAKQHLMQRFPHRVAFHKGKAHQQKPRKQGPKPCRQALFRAFFARR